MDLQPLVNNPFFQVGNALATFLGTLLALYVLAKAKKSLKYALTESRMFDRTEWGRLDENVHLTSSAGPLARLTRSHLLIWNEGPSTVHFRDDVAEIRFEPGGGGRIIQARVLLADDEYCAPEALVFDHRVLFKFDYLLAKDAILFCVDHSGECGTIRGWRPTFSNVTFHVKQRRLAKSTFVDTEYWHTHDLLKYGPLALMSAFAAFMLIMTTPLSVGSAITGSSAALWLYWMVRLAKRFLGARRKGGALYHYMKHVRSIDDREIRNNPVSIRPLRCGVS